MHPKELTHIVWHFELVFALPYSAKVLFLFVCKPLLVNINKDLQMLQTVNGKFALWQLFGQDYSQLKIKLLCSTPSKK